MAEPMIKGAAVREFLAWYEQRHGREAVRRLAQTAPEDLRAALDPDDPITTLLASSWYPARLVHTMLETVAADTSEAELGRLAREANRELVKNHGGVYRFVFEKLVSPQLYAMSVPRLWRMLHTTGERRIRIASPGEAESVVSSWAGHHPLLCVLTIETMCAVFESMGCADVKWERVSCVSRGGRECVTRVTWTP